MMLGEKSAERRSVGEPRVYTLFTSFYTWRESLTHTNTLKYLLNKYTICGI